MTGTAEGGLTFLDAAERVLEETPGHEPVSYRTITEQALQRGHLVSRGQTPASTMYVQLVHDVRRRADRGDEPRFSQFRQGRFGLAKWSEDELMGLIARRNRRVKEQLLALIRELDPPSRFETVVFELLTKMGFDAEPPRLTNDGGIDVYGTLDIGGVIRTRMAVQAKRWEHNVQAPTVQQVRGALGVHDLGLIITTSDFSSGARLEAIRENATPVALMNGNDLVSLLVEHQIGVRRTSADLLELVEMPWSAGGELLDTKATLSDD
ncbi:MAG: restriction endonuclease [Candidatus Limnocylindrales bacterium]